MVERSTILRWTIDVLIYGIILIMWQNVDKTIPKVTRPFICEDKSLSLPYKNSTVRGIWLHYYFYGTMIIILLIEFLLEKCPSYKKRIFIVLIRTLKWFKYYFICFISLVIVCSTIKNLHGSLRPFFFEVCKPNITFCVAGNLMKEYECTNTEISEYALFESQRSFPSGHAYSVTYSSFVLMFYIQSRFIEMPSKLLVVFTYLMILLWTSFCCVTRISDNWHHPIDVIGAIILTIPFAFYTCHVLCKNFERRDKTKVQNS